MRPIDSRFRVPIVLCTFILLLVLISVLVVYVITGNKSRSNYNTINFINKHSPTPIDKTTQAIKILLDNIMESSYSNNEKYVVIIDFFEPSFLTPTDTILWFRYNNNDKYIIVNYFSFPVQEKISVSPYDTCATQLNTFLEEIILNKEVINIENAKRIKVPLPVWLQNETLLNKMYDDLRYSPRTGQGPSYYWGIKSDKIELICHSFSYVWEFYDEIVNEILEPITAHVRYQEMPAQWKNEYKMFEKLQRERYKELGIIK